MGRRIFGLALILILATGARAQSAGRAQDAVPNPDVLNMQKQLEQQQTPILPRGLMGMKDFKLTVYDAEGRPFAVESLRGKPVLLLFWASWWEPSVETLGAFPGMAKTGVEDGAVVLAIDRERQAATADAYLAKKHIGLTNYHYDPARVDPAVREGLGGAVEFVLIDRAGTVVYQNGPSFLMELHTAMGRLDSVIPKTDKPRPQPVNAPMDPGALLTKTITAQTAYTARQTGYACNYNVRTAGSYVGGLAHGVEQHASEAFFLQGGELQSGRVSKEGVVTRDVGAASIPQTYKVWTSPLLASIAQHSILSNQRRVKERDGTTRMIFTFRGDPRFQPKTDVDRIAQALEGEIRIDETQQVFTWVDGLVAYDVIDGERLLMQRGLPLLDYHSVPFDGVYLPSVWSVAESHPVNRTMPNFRALWMAGFRRTFVQLEGCQPFQAPGAPSSAQ